MKNLREQIGKEIPAWTTTYCDHCGNDFHVTRCGAKILKESDLTCFECRDDINKHAEIDALTEEVERLRSGRDEMKATLEKIHDSMAGNGEYGEFYYDVKELLIKVHGES